MTNDAWPLVRGTANGRGAPLLLMDHYSKGVLYVLTVPENPNDLYSLPQPVLASDPPLSVGAIFPCPSTRPPKSASSLTTITRSWWNRFSTRPRK